PGAPQLYQPPQAEQHAPLVLVDDADRRAQPDENDEDDDAENDQRKDAHWFFLLFLSVRFMLRRWLGGRGLPALHRRRSVRLALQRLDLEVKAVNRDHGDPRADR